MKAILIPVKEFARSKERLSPYFSADERAGLAAAMCEDFFRVIAQLKGVDCVYVVSKEYHALTLAKQLNWRTISETEQISESASVDGASRLCEQEGVKGLLRIPIDLPLAAPEDIESILAEVEDAPSAVIVPSRDGTGTNALLRSRPTLFPSHFGPGSFALHVDEAERAGARIKIVRNARIAVDVDDEEDLKTIAELVSPNSATAHWLKTVRRKSG